MQRSSKFRRVAAPSLILMAALALAAGRCEADMMLRVEPSTAAAGGSGAFDVHLEVLSGSYDVSSFSFGLEVGPGVEFTGASAAPLGAAYIFGGLRSPDFTYTTFPSPGLVAGDSLFDAPGSVTLVAGDVVGLGRISYEVAAGAAAGVVAISFLLGGETEILDVTGAPLTFDVAPGAITVTSSGAIPEPSSLALLGLSLAPAFAAWRRRAA